MKFFSEVFFSFTYGGECIGLAAAKACIEKLESKKVLQHINKMGKTLKNGINEKIKENNLEDYFGVSVNHAEVSLILNQIMKKIY